MRIFKILIALYVMVNTVTAFAGSAPYEARKWQIGDKLVYRMESKVWGKDVGRFSKEVVDETPTSFWVKSNAQFDAWTMPDTEILSEISKKSGEMLTKFVNGKRVAPDKMTFTFISASNAEVPAGEFQCKLYRWDTSGNVGGAEDVVLCIDTAHVGLDGTVQSKSKWYGDDITFALLEYTAPH